MAKIDEILLVDIAHKGDFVLDAQGDLDTISGRPNVIDAIFRRIVTRKGALIHRPEYGAGLGDYQGLPNSIDNQLRLLEDIKQNLSRDERIVSIKNISINIEDDTPSKMTIILQADILGLGVVTVEELLDGA